MMVEKERVVMPSKSVSAYRANTSWTRGVRKELMHNWDLYLLILPVLAYFLLFCYYPMYGAQIAFRDYRATRGILGSEWIGLEHFERFFRGAYAERLIMNSLSISFWSLICGFPLPILLALMLNEIRCKWFKKSVQLVTYAPYFLSTVVMVGILNNFLSLDSGIINNALKSIGKQPVEFMTSPAWFKPIYILSGLWQGTGYGSIVYLAALAGIDISLYEAAMVDGASRIQRMLHITLPCILPTAVIMLILNSGSIMNVGFEKVFLMQNDINNATSEVISTYVYKSGLINADFSFASAVGLFNSVVSFVMVMLVNFIAKRLGETSLF